MFVPGGWDSWGKIRVLRDGFDVEGVCTGWSVDLASVLGNKETEKESETVGGALEVYEDTVSDPKRVSLQPFPSLNSLFPNSDSSFSLSLLFVCMQTNDSLH